MNGVLYIERSEQFRLTRSLSFSLNFCALFWVWCAVLFIINLGQPCPLYSLPSLKFRFPVYINYLPLGLVCGSLLHQPIGSNFSTIAYSTCPTTTPTPAPNGRLWFNWMYPMSASCIFLYLFESSQIFVATSLMSDWDLILVMHAQYPIMNLLQSINMVINKTIYIFFNHMIYQMNHINYLNNTYK